MKSLDVLFSEYSKDHQNALNQKIHYICVPVIVYSLIGLLWCVPQLSLGPLSLNWAWVFAVSAMIYYVLLSRKLAAVMLVFVALFFLSFDFMESRGWPLWQINATLFAVAWIGQFYGHKVEGQKPSFLTDLTYLSIGPLWVLEKLFGSNTNSTK